MGNKQSSVIVNVYIDREKEKVMFAEVQETFVEILFSIMTLPMGRIIRLCNHTYSKDTKVGSLTSLYQSVAKLDSKLFWEGWKYYLLHPINSSASICRKLKVNLDDYYGNGNGNGNGNGYPVFIKNKGSFLITDDLKITPFSLDQSILLLNFLGVECIDLLEKRTMRFGYMEFSELLKWSLLTTNPMTNVVIKESKPELYSCFTNSSYSLSSTTLVVKPRMIKLLVQKSKKRVIRAIVDDVFVDLLFSFLTIPLGSVKRLTMDMLSPLVINNVYNSISYLGNAKFLKSDVKIELLDPKLSPAYFRATDFLPIYQDKKRRGSFLMKKASFIISDDLKIEVAQPSVSDITKVTFGIPVGDIEILDVSIGEQEALFILQASLTSTTVLTDFLNKFKKPKV